MLENIKNMLAEQKNASDLFKRNLAKEYLQVLALSFIYSKNKYKNLIFYGGSALKHCRGMDRLSEDLDFVDEKGAVPLEKPASELKLFFKNKWDLKIETKIQKFRIVLKFPVLYELKLADYSQSAIPGFPPEADQLQAGIGKRQSFAEGGGQSDILYLKLEIFKNFPFYGKYKTEVLPRDHNAALVTLKRALYTVGTTGIDAWGDLASTLASCETGASRVAEPGKVLRLRHR